jgi:hypothetical protein
VRYDTIHPLHTFFLGNLSLPKGERPEAAWLIENAEPRLVDFLLSKDTLGVYSFSYCARATIDGMKLYAVYIHFHCETTASAFRLIWDGEPPLRNY